MDPLTVAAICTLIVKGQAAVTAVPSGTDCRAIISSARASASRASARFGADEDLDAIGRVAWAEAANQGERGLAAVVFTIVNRLGDGRWGTTVSQVLNAPRQFEPVLRAGGDWRNLPAVPAARRPRMDALVALALRGELADETGGALYFQNPTIVAARERSGQVSRGLTNFGGRRPSVIIGAHAFYGDDRIPGQQRAGRISEAGGPRGSIPEASSADQQDAYIEAGGAIFGEGSATAFDPAKLERAAEKREAGGPAGVSPKSRGESATLVVETGAEPQRSSPASTDHRAGDEGGMFVLPNGRTSAGPPQ